MCKVIAICNQKGGVSKTTITANLGVGLVRAGKKVLVIDADPQGNLSQSLGIKNPDELDVALPDMMEQIIMDKEVDVTKGIMRCTNFGEKNTVYMHWRRCGVRSESVVVSLPV